MIIRVAFALIGVWFVYLLVLLSELVVLHGCCLIAGCEFCGAGADLDWFGCWCVYLVIAASLG